MNKIFIALFLVLSITTATAAEKVQLQFFYESLCPGCYQYLRTALKKALYTEGLDSIFDLQLYPYGNGRQKQVSSGLWEFTCQHGAKECYGNMIESCVLGLYHANNSNKAVICIEEQEHSSGNFDAALQVCATSFQLDVERIQKCVKGSEGNEFQHQIASTTDNLNPPHQWVPWMVVNGQYNEADQDALEDNPIKFICQKYQGSDKPSACNQYLEKDHHVIPRSSKQGFCPKADVVKSFLN